MKIIKIGYILPDRKSKKLGLNEVAEYHQKDNLVILKKIDIFSDEYNQKERFDMVIQKFTDVVYSKFGTNISCDEQNKIIENYLNNLSNPMCIIIDPPCLTTLLQNRKITKELIKRVILELEDSHIKLPKHVVIEAETSYKKLKDILFASNISFPIIVKPIAAQASDQRYNMSIYFDEKALNGDKIYDQCLVEEFINHDGVVYKIYAIFSLWYVVKIRSFNNIDVSKKEHALNFNTKILNNLTEGSEELNKYISSEVPSLLYTNKIPQSDDKYNLLDRVVKITQLKTGCKLIGIDVIFDSDMSNYYIIDVNYLPSYKYIPTFIEDLISESYKMIENK